MAFTLLVLFIVCVLGLAQAEPCDGCNAYKCVEDKEHCGPKGYPLAFGLKYCNRFFEPDVYDRYDEGGIAFIRCTKDCLIGVLQNWTRRCSNIPCDDLEGAAFTSHVNCYLSCGFCDICANNKAALWHTYDLKDFLSKHAWDQVVAVAKACGVAKCLWGEVEADGATSLQATPPPKLLRARRASYNSSSWPDCCFKSPLTHQLRCEIDPCYFGCKQCLPPTTVQLNNHSQQCRNQTCDARCKRKNANASGSCADGGCRCRHV